MKLHSLGLGAAAALLASTFGVLVHMAPPVAAVSRSATVTRWVDGDTVLTSRGRVRLIGIDTPELGTCGYGAATRRATRLAPPGTKVRLVDPGSVQQRDQYGRLLRFVQYDGLDVGLQQIRHGARARYDSRTGYDRHPREERYVRADRNHAAPACSKARSRQR